MIIAAVFVILGVAIKYGKMYFLIAGYNTMSKEEKAMINIGRVAILFRNVLFTMALVLVAGNLIIPGFDIPSLLPIVTTATILTGVIFLVVKSNSRDYKTGE